MALERQTVGRMIDAVSRDSVASGRINSIFGSGAKRNFAMALGQGVLDLGAKRAEGQWGQKLERGWNPFDPFVDGSIGARYNCVGIAEASVKAIDTAMGALPRVAKVSKADRQKGFAHAAVRVDTQDGGAYVVDWWVTLNVWNPMLFRFDDWNNNKWFSGSEYLTFLGFR